ncbi:hypothetical protein VV01_20865 [Luteipulveratus halotolerans]|uniref:Uncharacterized protein n=1 Tax=Luteipulveratus halotolerans TaxID=1631356 RepID=A0A0L6CMT8_9MICO|nr:hypothetical protein VV01_20865 [Luteipulveratus halotolerans]
MARLLASPAFTRARALAGPLADDSVRLRTLLEQVDRKTFGIGTIDDLHGRLDIDIACSVVEARAEELDEGLGEGVDDLDPTTSARLRLVIAALSYLVIDHDAIPDHRPNGHIDDVAIVRWVTQVAAGHLPPPHDDHGHHGPVAPSSGAPIGAPLDGAVG